MPHTIKRMLQRTSIMWRARKNISNEEARAKLQRPVHGAYQKVRENLNTPKTNETTNTMFGRIRSTNHRFALTRAFRAAGIFGNETRNELVNARTWGEVEKRIGKKRAEMMRRVYGQSMGAAREAGKEIFVEGEARAAGRNEAKKEPVQRPVHGRVIQGNFNQAGKKRAV